jgi:hypothetical protein
MEKEDYLGKCLMNSSVLTAKTARVGYEYNTEKRERKNE